MSQEYKLRLEELRQSNPSTQTSDKKISDENVIRYSQVGNARNICFILENDEVTFLNYAYLVSGRYDRSSGIIVLTFTTDIVTLKGSGLDELFFQFMSQLPRIVEVANPRYAVLDDQLLQVTASYYK